MNTLVQILSMIFGLVPLNRLETHATTVLDYVLMVAVPIAYLGCYGLAVFGKFGVYKLPMCDSICRLANTLFMHLGCFLYLSIYFLTLLRRKNFFKQFESSIHDIDTIINKCQKVVDLPKKKQKKFRSSFYGTWILVILIFVYAVFYDTTQMFQYYESYFFVSIMITTFPYFAGSVVQGQFIHYVSLISGRFSEINNLFERISQECDRKNAPLTVYDIESNAKNVAKSKEAASAGKETKEKDDDESESSDFDDRDENVANSAIDGLTSETNLPDLFKLHDKVLSLSVITNYEFGSQCVPYMTACFVISIFGIFLETKVIFIVGGKSQLLDYVAFIYVVWSLIMMVVAYLVLRLCCNANAHSKQSAMIVHEIMQKKPAFMLGNDLYYNKMKSFTLQYLHWEGFFEFNGVGLFALDYTFIFSTVSAATSYLIVLLQFDMSAILKNEGYL